MFHHTSPLQACLACLLLSLTLPALVDASSFADCDGEEVYIDIPANADALKYNEDLKPKNGMRGKMDAKTKTLHASGKLSPYMCFVRFPDRSRCKFRTEWVKLTPEGRTFCGTCHKLCAFDATCSRPDCRKFNAFTVNLAKHCNTCHEPKVAVDEFMPWLPKGSHEAREHWGLEPVISSGDSCFKQDCPEYKASLKKYGYTFCTICGKVEVPVDSYTPVPLGSRKPRPEDPESPGVSCLTLNGNVKCPNYQAFYDANGYRRRLMAQPSSRLINRFIRESIRCQQS